MAFKMEMRIPNFRAIMAHWPMSVHPGYGAMKLELEWEFIKNPILTFHALNGLYRADVALYASSYWPRALPSRLRTTADFVLWLGVFDDYLEKLDRPEPLGTVVAALCKRLADVVYSGHGNGDDNIDVETAAAATICCIEKEERAVEDKVVGRLVQQFAVLMAPVLKAFSSPEQKAAFVGWLCEYIIGTTLEDPNAPAWSESPEEAMRIRSVAGAGTLSLSMSEFATGVSFPPWAYKTPAYSKLIRAGAYLIALINDVISLPKELRANFPCNSVAALVRAGHSSTYTAATQHIAEVVTRYVKAFDDAAITLVAEARSRADGSPTNVAHVESVVTAMREVCTGNLAWSETTRRYSREGTKADGSHSVRLGEFKAL